MENVKELSEEEKEYIDQLERELFNDEQIDYPDHEFMKGASYATA